MRFAVGLMAASFLGGLLPAHAQVYQVRLEIRDARAADKPAQHYSMAIDESRKGVFQAGQRVAGNAAVDTGVKIECAVRGSGDSVALNGSIEITEMAGTVSLGGSLTEPIIGQARFVWHKTVELGTPTAIVENARYKVEATVALLQAP